jgi:hypothetical protein
MGQRWLYFAREFGPKIVPFCARLALRPAQILPCWQRMNIFSTHPFSAELPLCQDLIMHPPDFRQTTRHENKKFASAPHRNFFTPSAFGRRG